MRVLVNSIPKSGTHLLVRLCQLLDYEPLTTGLSGALIRLTSRNPFKRWLKKNRRWHPGTPEQGFAVDLDSPELKIRKTSLDAVINKIPDGSCIPCHLPYSAELETYFLQKDIRIIFIHRDPRDVALSYCNHMLRDPAYPLNERFRQLKNYDQMLPYVLDGYSFSNGGKVAPLSDRVERNLGWVKSERTLSITFERLIGPEGGGLPQAQEDEVNKVLSHLDITLDPEHKTKLLGQIFYKKAKTFHKGAIGTWRREFGPEAREKLNVSLHSSLKRLGYKNDD